MPRNQNAGNLALRNRNRVTNKTRLKVVKGNIDADPIILDEDEERARVISTAGVDAEDANVSFLLCCGLSRRRWGCRGALLVSLTWRVFIGGEFASAIPRNACLLTVYILTPQEHHLQAVLSAASHRATTHAQRSSRAEKVEKRIETTTLIPVPDAAGLVENHTDLYPENRWVSPTSYVKFSDPVEDCVTTAIADGYTYFMDERDVEWLEKNNQDARGEGTSTQASGSSGTTTRSGTHRSAKSRGKEPETHQAIFMSEDHFELVMGLMEKITHDNTPFLHVVCILRPSL